LKRTFEEWLNEVRKELTKTMKESIVDEILNNLKANRTALQLMTINRWLHKRRLFHLCLSEEEFKHFVKK